METQQRQFAAVGAALIGIKPADEIEGMLAKLVGIRHYEVSRGGRQNARNPG